VTMQNPFDIDENDLATEWRRQPGLSREAGAAEADARHAHAQAKARLAVVEARLRLAVRRNPGKYGLPEKPTVDAVNDTVTLEDDYAAAVRAVDEAKHAVDLLSTNTVAMVDRRKALENLVQLLSLNYYAEQEPKAKTLAARDEISRRTPRADRERPIDSIE
jgi:hypothetical protein